MPEQMRPASAKQAPDPAVTYERSDPKRESGQGQVKANDKATPTPSPDQMHATVTHAQPGDKQVNSEEAASTAPKPESAETESLGWEKTQALSFNVSMRHSAFFAVIIGLLTVLIRPALGDDPYKPDASKTDFASLEANWHDADRNSDVPVKVYYPVPAQGKLPIIIFSHGLGGSREGYSYVGEYWAAHGYVSVHLTHAGSDTDAVIANGLENLQQQAAAIATNPKIAVGRCKDVSFAIDQLVAFDKDDTSPLKDHLDFDRIGMAGHSYGANTTMLISGELTRSGKTFADSRIKCAIAMSPPVATAENTWDKVYAKVKIPLFVMTGTLDDSPIGDTTADQRRVPFDHVVNIPAFLITFDGGDHMVFSGHRRGPAKATDALQFQLIKQGTLAFWDAYLRGNEDAKKWFTGDGYKKLVGDAGKFEERDVDQAKK